MSLAVKRALSKVENALVELGFEVVPFTFDTDKWTKMRDVMMGLLANGPAKQILDGFYDESEAITKHMKSAGTHLGAGAPKRTLLDFVNYYLLNNGRKYTLFNGLRQKSEQDLDLFLKLRSDLCLQLATEWKEAGLTALISPCFPTCAFKAENASDLCHHIEYCMLQSLTGLPSGTMPVTRVRANEQNYADMYRDSLMYLLEKDVHDAADMPIAV